MKKKVFSSVCIALIIIIIVALGTTLAFFSASVSNEDVVRGEASTFDVELQLDTVYKASQLVPLSDSLVSNAISKSSDKCIDSQNYEVCTLYTLTLSNSGKSQVVTGYVSTDTTTYTTDNLKYQIFDSNYNAITDTMTISRVTSEKAYFKKDDSLVNTSIDNTNIIYYLAIWLSETGTSQSSDYSKTFTGKVGFESTYGDNVTATFNT